MSTPAPIRTTCPYCGVGCGLRVQADSGGVRIDADPDHPANRGRICVKGATLADTLELEDRILRPEVGGRPASWRDALAHAAGRLRYIIRRHGPEAVAFYLSGQLLTEDYYVANKLIKGFIGSPHVDTNSRLCMSSTVAGHQRAFGEDLVPGCYEDLEMADLVVLVGSNAALCHPVLFQRIEAVRRARPQMYLVVIDPRRTATALAADLHLPLRPGTDVALFNGLAGSLVRAGLVTAPADAQVRAWLAQCAACDVEAVARACDLPAAALARFYTRFAATERVVTLFSQGVNQSSAGTDKVNAIVNCHLLTGRIGRPGCGPLSLTGQPNAMGGREVGGLATTLAAHIGYEDEAGCALVQRFWRAPRIAKGPGLTAVALFDAVAAGRIRALWIMGTNPAVSMPDAEVVRRALAGCELVIVSDCVRSDTTRFAHVLLPAATWGEKDGTVTNSERRISRQRAFRAPPGQARADWRIITALAQRLGHRRAFTYTSPWAIFREHARLSGLAAQRGHLFDLSGLADLDAAAYDALAPVQWPVPPSRPGGTPRLTAIALSGRVRVVPVLPRAPTHGPERRFPFILNTGRLREHWHTMTRTACSARLSAAAPEPFVALHPADAAACGLAEGDIARVSSAWGTALLRVRLDGGQRRGEVFAPMHWSDRHGPRGRIGPVVSPATDPVSRQPELKHTPVHIERWPATWHAIVLARHRPDPPRQAGYWTYARVQAGWRLALAGRERPSDWASLARHLLGGLAPETDWVDLRDPAREAYRAAALAPDGTLNGWIAVAGAPEGVPAPDWTATLFERGALSRTERIGLLAGRMGSPCARLPSGSLRLGPSEPPFNPRAA